MMDPYEELVRHSDPYEGLVRHSVPPPLAEGYLLPYETRIC
jgi:hypothetical protein